MKIPTFTAISFALTFTACVETASHSQPPGIFTLNDAPNTRVATLNTCLRAANAGTQSKEDNLEFFKNCLHQYGLETDGNGVIISGTTEQRGDDAPKNDTSISHITKKGNNYYVPVRINDTITLPFVLDTGANDLVIPADVALTLMRAGALRRSDFIGQTPIRVANGSEDISDVVVLRDVRVGDHAIRNVRAIITPAQSEPLLGQSFLSKFGAVTIDYKRLILVLSP